MALLSALLALAALCASAARAAAEDSAGGDTATGLAIVPDAAPAVIDYASEKDPCKLLALAPSECAAKEPGALTRAYKAARRAAQRSGGGPEAAEAIEAAYKALRSGGDAAPGEARRHDEI